MTDERQTEIAQLEARLTELKGEPTVDDHIREAESAGDYGLAGKLKLNKYLAGQVEPSGSPVDDATLTKIRELEEAGDLMGAVQAKLEAARPQTPTIDPEAATQIAELESEEKWTEAGVAKLRAAGMEHLIPR